jgi:hypothetical protein
MMMPESRCPLSLTRAKEAQEAKKGESKEGRQEEKINRGRIMIMQIRTAG